MQLAQVLPSQSQKALCNHHKLFAPPDGSTTLFYQLTGRDLRGRAARPGERAALPYLRIADAERSAIRIKSRREHFNDIGPSDPVSVAIDKLHSNLERIRPKVVCKSTSQSSQAFCSSRREHYPILPINRSGFDEGTPATPKAAGVPEVRRHGERALKRASRGDRVRAADQIPTGASKSSTITKRI